MSDYACNYCQDKGDCTRCSSFFQPTKVHKECGRKRSEHEVRTGDWRYPPVSLCPSTARPVPNEEKR